MSSFYGRHKVWVWAGVWVLTRAAMVVQVGFWNHATGLQLEDTGLVYHGWSDELSRGVLPGGETWQYPPGAALVLLLPRLGLGLTEFGQSFVGSMLIFDLIGLAMVATLGRREGKDAGVWVWLLAMPMLRTLPILRFDLSATVLAVGGMLVVHRRPAWLGALAGLGATIKVWPIVLLFGEWDRRRLLRASLAAAVAIGLVFAISAIAFEGDQVGFLSEQGQRGLQIESVASLPWHLRQLITGEAPNAVVRYGAMEIGSHPADVVSDLLDWATLAVLVAAGVWWLARTRAIGRGRDDLASVALSRDFVFTVVLLLMITSRVLSSQYLIWSLALAAVLLSTRGSRLGRPAWIAVAAAAITAAAYGPLGAEGPFPIYGSPFNMVVRNLALLVAAIDASATMIAALRSRPAPGPAQREPVSAAAEGQPAVG
ncbi:MAG TPA: glycosyltransferase family 87 protein [Solirubrobacterales bacterium]|nr:glycosyltransferase family 87 protein [Solirubrobacterales bacterium]